MRILLIQLKRIGDVILTTPALAALRESFPEAHLTIAIDANAAGLADALSVDEVVVRRPADFAFWRKIATRCFDATLDFTGNDRSALITALSRAPRRITYQRFARKPLRRAIYTDFVDSSVRDRHTADHHTDLLSPLGVTIENVPSQLTLPPEAIAEAVAFLEKNAVQLPFTILHPGTARAEKYWDAEKWKQLAQQLGGPLVITGSNDPAEQRHLHDVLTPGVSCAAGALTLLGTAALIQSASLVIAVDSAPVHLADALGIPVIALFGPTNPFHWRPRNPRSHVIQSGKKMSDIAPDAVLDAINSSRLPGFA